MTRIPAALAAVLGLALATPASAQETPPSDARVHTVTYAPGEVYRVAGAFRTVTQIVFSPDETIRHAAIGDSVAWELAAEGSVLFLKPRERPAATNLLVVTARGAEIRHYAFELLAREPGGPAPAWQVRFRYPADDQAAAARALAEAAQAAERRLVSLQLRHAALEGPRNLAWSAQGDATLQPAEVTDNGRFTVLHFAGGQALPALFEVGEDGGERLVPYDVRGEFVVVHGVPRALRLRRGGAVLCLFNDAHDPRGGADTGAASPAVERRLPGDPS